MSISQKIQRREPLYIYYNSIKYIPRGTHTHTVMMCTVYSSLSHARIMCHRHSSPVGPNNNAIYTRQFASARKMDITQHHRPNNK